MLLVFAQGYRRLGEVYCGKKQFGLRTLTELVVVSVYMWLLIILVWSQKQDVAVLCGSTCPIDSIHWVDLKTVTTALIDKS